MFGLEFFPTPPSVIRKMVDPYLNKKTRQRRYGFETWDDEIETLDDLIILEPSAGKGDILDFINENYKYRSGGDTSNYYCIEKHPDLQHILREKKYKVIASDFLSYTGENYFDLILMNPPFSNGDEHLLKAWEILEQGNICCLLNAETIRNPYSERRKLICKLVEDHGEVEYLGQCFQDAENKTDVEVAMVRLRKVAKKKKLDFEFKQVTSEKGINLTEETLLNEVATMDVIGNMILQYEKIKEVYVEFMKAREALNFYSQGLLTKYAKFDDIIFQAGSRQKKFNGFTNGMKKEIWKVVVDKLNIQKFMTHSVRQNFDEFTQHQGALDFTKENVSELVNLIFENRYSILDKAVVEVFDIFTQYHKENRCHIEGWKTNDKWKVNRKIILPRWVRYGEYMTSYDLKNYGDDFKTNYSYHSEYSDIDKVMCYITGTDFEECGTIYQALENKFRILGKVGSGSFDGTCESEFFNLRFFKKGTLHIEFKDEKLWQEFNLRACAGKQWLPDAEMKAWKESKQPKQEETKKVELPQLPAPVREPVMMEFDFDKIAS